MIIGVGTLINVACIIAGGIVGLCGGRFLVPRMQDTIMKATGLCILFVGLAGTLEQMLAVEGDHLTSGGT